MHRPSPSHLLRRLGACLAAVATTTTANLTPANAAQFALNGHQFTLPDGFSIELVAGQDLVPRPIAGSFDPQGRLYVTDSSGSNKPPAEQLKDPQSRILRLEDTDGDGRFDKSTVFAERVMFPQGCLWHDGSVYVAGPPSIWKFTDTNGDGTADRREEWYQGNVLTGCANDVHGPYLGPEGMLYWTKGAFSRLDLKDAKGRPINDRCAHIFRSWPDGSGMETVISGGMDNPVEVAFTAEGEPIVISTFIDLSQPGRRDGLGHAVYGGVFGKINDVVEEPIVRRTGDLLPVMSHFGPAAACALMRYEGDAFGPDYRDNLFGTLFNLRKVTRHVLLPTGATYTTQDTDFLVSDHIDFRPTDVLQDVDGSLLVVDTGGWYKLCCPSSQLAKADVLGAIYRVRRADARALTPAERLAAYPRLTRPPALHPQSPVATLKRSVLAPKPDSLPTLLATLRTNLDKARTSPEAAHLARLAAEGLGRIGPAATTAVPDLFAALDAVAQSDRFLEHSLLFALLEIGNAQAVRKHLESPNPTRRRAALLVLEQIGSPSSLVASDVAPWLNSPEPALRETAQWIVRRHAEWASDLAGHFRQRLVSNNADATEKSGWENLLPLFARKTEGFPFLSELVTDPRYRNESRIAALAAMASSGTKQVPGPWRDALLHVLTTPTPPPDLLLAAIRATRALPFPKEGDPQIVAALRRAAPRDSLPLPTRVEAITGLPANSSVDDAEFDTLRLALQPTRTPTEKLAAANAVARLRFTPAQLAQLAPTLATAGPLELPRLFAAFGPGGSDDLGATVLDAITKNSSLRSIRPDDLLPHLARFPTPIRDRAEQLLAANRSDAAQDRARLDALLADILKLDGQIRRGQNLFNSTKAACATCHRLGYLGGDLGPDLTSIGQVRTERDLLEALVYPSASLVRSYEPWIAETRDGEEYGGVIRRDTPDELVLATGPGAEVRLRRSDLRELRPGTLSIMPAGLDEQLTRQELADLIAFLKNTKWGVN